jgi:hypothetical protein
MLLQILSHTPLYVWAILAFLVARGVAASRTRDVKFAHGFIVPLVMLALALQGVLGSFGGGTAALAWLAALALTAALTWRLVDPLRIEARRVDGIIRERGSWQPLVLMLAIFCAKYAVNVALAVAPQLRGSASFTVAACVLFGAFNGIFIGKLLRNASLYLRQDVHIQQGSRAPIKAI